MVSDIMKKRRAMNPFGLKRTSKQKKNSAGGVGGEIYHHFAGVEGRYPWAIIRDALVGGVNAEHLVHGRGAEEDEERRGRDYLPGGMFGVEMAF